MLTDTKLDAFKGLIFDATNEELLWMNGYLSGRLSVANDRIIETKEIPAAATIDKITIAYGTETGNAKSLATKLATVSKQRGINVKLANLEQYRLTDLVKEKYFFTVVSTQGDGEPPAGAKKFYDHIHNNALQLSDLQYGVIALGDSSYPLFCKAGEDINNQLKQHGAKEIANIQKCDVEYEDIATEWFINALGTITNGSSHAKQEPKVAEKKPGKKLYTGKVLTNINLNDRGSNKETYHIELGAEDVDYEPGDAIGIVPKNEPDTIAAIAAITGIDTEKKIQWKGETYTVFQLLHEKLNITCLSATVLKKYAAIVQQDIPSIEISLLNLLSIYPVSGAAQFEQVIQELQIIAPRLYSISSAPGVHSGEVHITVAKDRFSVYDKEQYGLCSNYLSGFQVDGELDFYVHKNRQFKLPEGDKDIIMIGPGAGIAPFRSFLHERNESGATARNWLFFGDQHFVSDFLYQTEIQDWVNTGVLSNIDLAFSRDKKGKVYVQHRILNKGAEFFEWLKNGAYIYVCGAKHPMSTDVEEAILKVIIQHGGKSETDAIAYLEQLKENGTYIKDVY